MEEPLQGMGGSVVWEHRVELRVYPAIFDSPRLTVFSTERKNKVQGLGTSPSPMSCSNNVVLFEMPRYCKG